jgi:hypothetical protein
VGLTLLQIESIPSEDTLCKMLLLLTVQISLELKAAVPMTSGLLYNSLVSPQSRIECNLFFTHKKKEVEDTNIPYKYYCFHT